MSSTEKLPTNHRPHGFTLIELLVVISIVSILMAILLPALSKARMSAVTLQCSNQQRQVYLSFVQYAGDFNDLFPQKGLAGNSFGDGTDGIWASFVGRLMQGRYLDPKIHVVRNYDPPTSNTRIHTGLLGCPSMKAATGWGSIVGLTSNPYAGIASNIGSTYGLNWQMWRTTYPTKVLGAAAADAYPINPDRIPKASGTFMLGDAPFKVASGGALRFYRRSPSVGSGTDNYFENVDFRHGTNVSLGGAFGTGQIVNYDGIVNITYFDGHVRGHREEDVPQNTTSSNLWTGGL